MPSYHDVGGASVWDHVDPFHDDATARNQPDSDKRELEPTDTLPDGEDGLRLAGVRSENPFASSTGPVSTADDAGERPHDSSVGKSGWKEAYLANQQSAAGPITSQWTTETDGIDQPDPDALSPRDAVTSRGAAAEQAPDGPPARPEYLETTDTKTNDVQIGHGLDASLVDPQTINQDAGGHDLDGTRRPSSSRTGNEKRRVDFADYDKVEAIRSIDQGPGEPDSLPHRVKTAVKDKFHLLDMRSSGPFKKMNPTRVRIRASIAGEDQDADQEVGILWRSRDNRKGRNSVMLPQTAMAYPNLPSKNRPVYSSSLKGVGRNLLRMAFTFPYWDMAFWSGWSYTWGSVLFVIDGVWAWGPVGWPSQVTWSVESNYISGAFFFVGALLYQLGAVMAWLEAVNDGSFHGSAMKRFLEGHEDDKKRMLDEKVTHFFGHLNPLHQKRRHAEEEAEEKRMAEVDPSSGWRTIHRRERPGSIYPGSKIPAPRRGGVDLGETEEGESHEYLTWRWWPTLGALKTHHIYEVGFIACSIQLFGATLYSWCGLVSLRGISSEWTANATWYGGYWFPEVFGSCCFLFASLLFIVETQEHWWKPELSIMGYWIGLWAMIGSWGFLLNGIFGIVAQARPELDWAEFASECCTTWGSFGYLCSALCQWYEAVNKHPVEELLTEPGDMKSWQIHPV